MNLVKFHLQRTVKCVYFLSLMSFSPRQIVSLGRKLLPRKVGLLCPPEPSIFVCFVLL